MDVSFVVVDRRRYHTEENVTICGVAYVTVLCPQELVRNVKDKRLRNK